MSNEAERVVADLVSAGLVHPQRGEEARAVVTRALGSAPTGESTPGRVTPTPSATAGGTRRRLVEIAGYAGGGLVMSAVVLFLSEKWDALSGAAQVATLAGIAVILAVAGVVVSVVGGGVARMRSGRDDVRRRLSSALLVAGALAAAVAVGLQVDLLDGEGYSEWPPMAGFVTMVALSVGAYAYAASALALLAVAVASYQAVMTGWALGEELATSSAWAGLTLMALGLLWLAWAELRGPREPVLPRVIGLGFLLLGAQTTLLGGGWHNTAYALTAAVAVLGFVLYLRTVSWPYLAAGVLGITLVVPEAVIDWTGGALGPAGAVLVAGMTLLAAALVGLRVRQEATDEPSGRRDDEALPVA